MDGSCVPHGVASASRDGIPRAAKSDLAREDDDAARTTVPAWVLEFRPENPEPTPAEKFQAYLEANPYVRPPPRPLWQQVVEGVALLSALLAFEAGVGVILWVIRALFNALR